MSFKSASGTHRVKEESVIRVEDIIVNNIPVFGTDGKMRDSGLSINDTNIPTNEYSVVGYVSSSSGNNINAKLNNSNFKYKDISVATQAVKDYLLAHGSYVTSKGLVVVDTGVYNEYHINRDRVDMYFNNKAIVYSSTNAKAVFDDDIEPLNIKVWGLGEFYHTLYSPSNDTQAVVTHNPLTKTFRLSCYELDGIQNYGGYVQSFEYSDFRMRFTLDHWNNVNINFNNITFLSGLSFGHFRCANTKININNSEIILPSDNWNSLKQIIDIDGNLVATINPSDSYFSQPSSFIDTTSGLTRIDVKNLHPTSTTQPTIAGIHYNEDSVTLNDVRNYKIEIQNSVVRVRKENCLGILIVNSKEDNITDKERGYISLKNIHIEDETLNKTTTAIAVKKLSTIVNPRQYTKSGITSNCQVFEDNSAFESGYEILYNKYKTEGVYLPTVPTVLEDGYIVSYDESSKSFKLKNDSNSIISTTYSNVLSLKNGSNFTVGQMYKITHQTKHLIHNTSSINVGTPEDLILTAVTKSKISTVVVSTLYPNDIIHFDINDVLCEDSFTPREGKITYRKDTINNISTYYDFRNVKTRRWPSDDILYPSSLPISVSAGTNGTNYMDYYTIENSQNPTLTKNVSIGKSTTQAYSNNMLFTQYVPLVNIHLSDDCNNNYIGEGCSNNWFGFECNNNVLHGANINNFFMSNCDSNILEWGCYGNRFGDNCYHNIIIDYPTSSGNYVNNDFGNNCQNNIVRGNDNKFETSCKNLVLVGICSGNYFCAGIQNKTFNGYLSNCRLLIQDNNVKTFANSYSNVIVNLFDYGSSKYYYQSYNGATLTQSEFL